MRLAIVQYAGDYREAFDRFAAGGKSTYHAQRYSVDFVGSLAAQMEQVITICAVSSEAYDVVLPNGVRAIGGGLRHGFHPRELVPLIARTQPDRLCLRTPMVPVLTWARRNRVRTMTMLADSFGKGGPRTTINNLFLARELNHPNVELVGNHGIGACLSLLDIAVGPGKVIPWDWPRMHRPYDYTQRNLKCDGKFNLSYVGSMSEAKGVGDVLRALRLLDNVGLTVIGQENGEMAQLAKGLDVRFTGIVWNEDIPREMRKSHAVVVPSRHEYPEGLPGTLYQALAARTPIIASDHPMFRGAIAHEQSALVFPARNEAALAASIQRLRDDAQLYAKLSVNSLQAWEAIQLPVKWGDLIKCWISDTGIDAEWLERHELLSGRYDRQIAERRECAVARNPLPRLSTARRRNRTTARTAEAHDVPSHAIGTATG